MLQLLSAKDKAENVLDEFLKHSGNAPGKGRRR
jgi:hypothetical protein